MAETIERARELLGFINANCERERWVNVGMALHDEFGQDGWPLFDEWSAESDQYSASDTRSVWKSFKPGGGRTFATVVQYAKEDGGYDPKKAKHKKQQVSPEVAAEQQAKAAARRALHDKEEAEESAAAALRAQKRWDEAKPASPDHLYFKSKGVKPHGVRVAPWRKLVSAPGEPPKFITLEDVLQIPMLDRWGVVHGLQGITTTGEKLFMSGAAKKGHFFKIGAAPLKCSSGKPVAVFAEGFATAASIHEATGHLVFCCFDLGNMLYVARETHARQGDRSEIILACDNDTETRGNPGRTKATALALELGLLLAVPPPGDFNDLAQTEAGAEAIVEAIEGATVPTAPFVAPDAVQTGVDALGEGITVTRLPKPERKYEFGSPVDLFNVMPPPVLPLNCFPASIRNYAFDEAERMGCDPSIVAISGLVAVASMIHDGIKIQPMRHNTKWRESARLWVAVVGPPSTQKSPAIKAAISHVEQADDACAKENQASEAQYLAQYEKWRKEVGRGDGGSRAKPARPPRKRRVLSDVTVEAACDVLQDNESGVLLYVDELAGWLGGMDAYKGGKGGDRAFWLETYNGGAKPIDRVSRGSIRVPNLSVCIVGGIQPATIKKYASGIELDGLLQRFMVLVARPRIKGVDRAPDPGAQDGFKALFEYLNGLQPTTKSVLLSDAAHLVLERVDEKARALEGAFEEHHMQAWLGKWGGLFARLLLTMHVCESFERGVYPTTEPVSGELASRVEELLFRGLLLHARHFYAEVVDANQHHEHVRQVAGLILSKDGCAAISKRELATGWKAYRTLKEWEVQAVVGSLCTYGWLDPMDGAVGHDGKPNRWCVNPQVHEVFKAHAEKERQRREAGRKVYLDMVESGRAANDPGSAAA